MSGGSVAAITSATVTPGATSTSTSPSGVTSVLEVLYLVFNEGYAATSGQDLLRRGLCDEARRLVRLLVEVAPGVTVAEVIAATEPPLTFSFALEETA